MSVYLKWLNLLVVGCPSDHCLLLTLFWELPYQYFHECFYCLLAVLVDEAIKSSKFPTTPSHSILYTVPMYSIVVSCDVTKVLFVTDAVYPHVVFVVF